MTTPEAEPEQKEPPKEPKNEPAKEMPEIKTEGEGASAEMSPEQQQKMLEQHLKEQQLRSPETSDEVKQSIWSISREKVRGPLGKLFIGGAVLAVPPLAGMVWVGDKLIRKVPIANKLYEKPRSLVMKGAEKTRNAVAAGLTAPTAALDITENIYEGITGREKKEAKGAIGRSMEWGSEKIGQGVGLLGKVLEAVKNGISKIPGGKIMEGTGKVIAAPFQLITSFITGMGKALTPKIGGPFATATSLLVTAGMGYGIYWAGTNMLLPALGPGAQLAWAQFLHWVTSFF